jgi:hypothetical protein
MYKSIQCPTIEVSSPEVAFEVGRSQCQEFSDIKREVALYTAGIPARS